MFRFRIELGLGRFFLVWWKLGGNWSSSRKTHLCEIFNSSFWVNDSDKPVAISACFTNFWMFEGKFLFARNWDTRKLALNLKSSTISVHDSGCQIISVSLFAPMGWEWSLSSVNSWLLAEGLDFCWHKQSTFCETVLRFYPHNEGRDIQARFQMRGFYVLRVEKQIIGHSPPFSSFIDKKHMQYSGLQLARNSAAILRSVQREANTRPALIISLNVH